MLDIKLDIKNYAQRKFVMPDPAGIIPRDMPFTICADAQTLRWSDEERSLIESDPDYSWLFKEFPPGLHIKPESGDQIKLGWAFNRTEEAPRWELPDDFDFPNIALRGASRFIPGLAAYLDEPPTPITQYAGYYTRTEENWPLIGPLGVPGVFTVTALAGYGTMAACGAGELCARWLNEDELPAYARYFDPARYSDPNIVGEIATIPEDGQL